MVKQDMPLTGRIAARKTRKMYLLRKFRQWQAAGDIRPWGLSGAN